MTRAVEARLWQGIGALTALIGGCMLAYDFERFGLASIEPRALTIGIASCFLLLTAGAFYIGGRSLHVNETELTPLESRLWKLLAFVCLIGGGAVIVLAWRQLHDLFLDRLTMFLVGSFAMMFGVLCLMGERVMSHMHDVLTREKAKGAGAS